VETAFFSVDLGKWFRGELAFHSGEDGLGILTNSFSFLLQFNCNGMLSRFWSLLFRLSRFALGSAIGALGRGGIRTHGSQKLRLISSHASANSDRIDNRFEYATNEALRSLGRDLSDLRGASEAKNLAALKKLVAPEQWPWAEPHAISFVRYAADLMPIDVLGDHAGFLLRGSAVQEAAEHFLMDIAKLESEKAEKAAKR